MMLKFSLSWSLLFLSSYSLAQSTAASPCAVGCVDGSFGRTADLGCGTGDRLCMCGKSVQVQDGIRDCINQACTAEAESQIPLAEVYGTELCNAASSSAGLLPTPAPTTAPPPESTTSQEPAPSTTASSTDTAAETTSSPSPSQSSEQSAQETTSQSTSLTSSTTTTSSDVAAKTSESTSQPPSSTSATGTIGAFQPSPSSASTSEADAAPSAGGLSTAAKAGIGAGAGVAVVLALILAVCVCLRRKQRTKDARRDHALKISKPLAGGGRQYAFDEPKMDVGRPPAFAPTPNIARGHRHSPSKGSSVYSTELDTHARRYEDMVPRTQPKIMI